MWPELRRMPIPKFVLANSPKRCGGIGTVSDFRGRSWSVNSTDFNHTLWLFDEEALGGSTANVQRAHSPGAHTEQFGEDDVKPVRCSGRQLLQSLYSSAFSELLYKSLDENDVEAGAELSIASPD